MSALIQAAIAPFPNREAENPSSLLKRRSAVGLLADIGVPEDKWSLLRPLLDEGDERILVSMFRIAGGIAGADDRESACRRLMEVLQDADWFLKGEIEDALVERFDAVRTVIEEELVRRSQASEWTQELDPVQITLRKAKYRIEQEGHEVS